MSNKTANYKMTLPTQDEFYDVDIFNENYSIIDEELKGVNDAIDGLATVAASGSYNDLTNKPNTGNGATVYTINSETFSQGLTMGDKPYAQIHQCMHRIVYVGLLSNTDRTLANNCGLFLYKNSDVQGGIGIQVNTMPTSDIKLVVVDLGAFSCEGNNAIVIDGLPDEQIVTNSEN